MRAHIRQVNVLTPEENERLFRWGSDIFGGDQFNLSWRSKDVHFLLDVDGVAVSHVGVLKHVIQVQGLPVAVAGFGGVVTTPDAQRRGHAHTLMRHAALIVGDFWRVDAGFLFCLPRMMAYYQRLGWLPVRALVTIDQPAGKVPSPLPVMVLPFGQFTWPAGHVETNSLPW